ncbi:MAG: hypothetical protein ACYDEV_05925 [Acidiferrobacter sp.]
MMPVDHYPLADLKLIYTTLHAALTKEPSLMDSALLEDLQAHLITEARKARIDVSDHGAWATWLADIQTGA